MCGYALVLSVGFCVRIRVHGLLTRPFEVTSFRHETSNAQGYDAMVIVIRANVIGGVVTVK